MHSSTFSPHSSQKPQVQALAGRAQTSQILSIGSILSHFYVVKEVMWVMCLADVMVKKDSYVNTSLRARLF